MFALLQVPGDQVAYCIRPVTCTSLTWGSFEEKTGRNPFSSQFSSFSPMPTRRITCVVTKGHHSAPNITQLLFDRVLNAFSAVSCILPSSLLSTRFNSLVGALRRSLVDSSTALEFLFAHIRHLVQIELRARLAPAALIVCSACWPRSLFSL